MDEGQLKHIKGVVEALLFVSEKAVSAQELKEVIAGSTVPEIRKAVKALTEDYRDRDAGMAIVEIANGYQMLSSSTYAEYIREFYKTTAKEKLSKPALEALAIIAYKQPVSRSDIEAIRGVNSDGVVTHLLEKGLVKITGRKEVPGRPFLYGTTTRFLEYFGLKNLDDMPNLEEFPSMSEEEVVEKSGLDSDQAKVLNGDFEQEADVNHLAQKTQQDLSDHDEKEKAIVHTRQELKEAIEEMDRVDSGVDPVKAQRLDPDSFDQDNEEREDHGSE